MSMMASIPRTMATPVAATAGGIRLLMVASNTRMDERGTPAMPLDVTMNVSIMVSCCPHPMC